MIEQLERQAARIATNRVIAGVHFPVDSMAGRMLGVALGEYFVGRCAGGQKFMGRKFTAAGIDSAPTTDFNPFNANQSSRCAIAVLFSNRGSGHHTIGVNEAHLGRCER